MREQSQQNRNIQEVQTRRIKDVIHANKVRESFLVDMATGKAAETPSEVIKKNRIADLNLKSACLRAPGLLPSFTADLRFSCSSETQAQSPGPSSKKGSNKEPTVREKERTSFDFTWMRLDMTVTRMTAGGGRGRSHQKSGDQFSYEVELEVSKIDWLLQFVNDEQRFRSVVRRFLQNAASLTRLMDYSRSQAKREM